MNVVQCIKHIIEVKLKGYIVMKHYVQGNLSHVNNKFKL